MKTGYKFMGLLILTAAWTSTSAIPTSAAQQDDQRPEERKQARVHDRSQKDYPNWDGHEDMKANHGQEALRIDAPVAALLKDLRRRGRGSLYRSVSKPDDRNRSGRSHTGTKARRIRLG